MVELAAKDGEGAPPGTTAVLILIAVVEEVEEGGEVGKGFLVLGGEFLGHDDFCIGSADFLGS